MQLLSYKQLGSIIDETQQDDRLKLVKKSYWKGFLWSTIVVTCSSFVAYMINRFFPLSEFTIQLLQVFSFIPESTALFGVMGWEIQSWGGKTPAERLDQKLFVRLSFIGIFFIVMAFSLKPHNTNKPNPETTSIIFENIKNETLLKIG